MFGDVGVRALLNANRPDMNGKKYNNIEVIAQIERARLDVETNRETKTINMHKRSVHLDAF